MIQWKFINTLYNLRSNSGVYTNKIYVMYVCANIMLLILFKKENSICSSTKVFKFEKYY